LAKFDLESTGVVTFNSDIVQTPTNYDAFIARMCTEDREVTLNI